MCTLKRINEVPTGFLMFNITHSEVNLEEFPSIKEALENFSNLSDNETETYFSMLYEEFKPFQNLIKITKIQ